MLFSSIGRRGRGKPQVAATGRSGPLCAGEKGPQEPPRANVNPRRLTLARTSDTEPVRLDACEPRSGVRDGARIGEIGDEARLPVRDGFLVREPRSARDVQSCLVDHNQRRVAVAHVPFGALRRIGRRRFAQVRIAREQAGRLAQIFRPAAARAPAAVRDGAFERDIECGAVDPGLAAGDDFHQSVVTTGVASSPYNPTMLNFMPDTRSVAAAGSPAWKVWMRCRAPSI